MVKFRPTTEEDLPLIGTWILADPEHRERMDSGFFRAGEGYATYCIEDGHGPIMFVRQEAEGAATRLHVQFPPDNKARVVAALREAYPKVAAAVKAAGYQTVVFDSCSIALIRFMKQFGFTAELKHEL